MKTDRTARAFSYNCLLHNPVANAYYTATRHLRVDAEVGAVGREVPAEEARDIDVRGAAAVAGLRIGLK